MFKRILVSSAIMAMCGTAVAGNSPAPYVGIGFGVNNTTYVYHDLTPQNDIMNLGKRGPVAELFAGYGGVVSQNMYLAGEIFINDGTYKSSNWALNADDDGVAGVNLTLKNRYSYGISFIPGVLLTNQTLAYVRLGLVRTAFSAVVDGDTGHAGTTNTTQTGGQLGLGLQTNLSPCWDLRAEYDYTFYGAFKTVAGTAAAPTTGYDVTPNTDQAKLSLIYKFA